MLKPLHHIFFTLALCSFVVSSALGQVTLNEFPTDSRLYARVGDERIVDLPILGTVTSDTGITSLSAKLLVGTQVIDIDTVQLTFNAGVATFELNLELPVTRTNHRVELRNATTDLLLASADFIVAGDVYVVNGQSNALAGFSIDPADDDPFIRGYRPMDATVHPGWTAIRNVACGSWMGRTANALSTEYDLPIAVFNFAEGGQLLSYFQPGATSQNFENVFGLLREAKVKDLVKGFLWSQGESDGYGTSIKSYRPRLTSLFEHYLDSFPLVNEVYFWQVRAFSCSGTSPNIMEAQRRINEELPYVKMLSTVNVEGDLDSCHFPYTNGRELLGNWMADVLRVEKYGAALAGYMSPTLDSARVTEPQKITLFFDLKGAAGLATTGTPWADFTAEGLGVQPVDGLISGGTVDLLFDADISQAEGVSYYAHLGDAMDYLHSSRGLGVVTFYNESLTPGDRASGSVPDAKLVMRSTVTNFEAGEDVEVEVELFNQGDRSLRETEVSIPLSAALRYGNGQSIDVTSGTFDEQTHTWLVPIVRPGASAQLTITYRILDAAQPISVWGEVNCSESTEVDSTPLNGVSGTVQEDDEARVVLGDPTKNCSFSSRLAYSECTPDSFSYWRIGFENEHLQNGAEATFRFNPIEAVNWQNSEEGLLSLSFDTLAARSALPLQISLSQDGDLTCGMTFTLDAPDSCRVTPTIVDTTSSAVNSPLLGELRFSPNPVKSGGILSFSQPSYLANQRVLFFDATGREVYSRVRAGRDPELQLPPLPAGLYFVRSGHSIGKVLIYE